VGAVGDDDAGRRLVVQLVASAPQLEQRPRLYPAAAVDDGRRGVELPADAVDRRRAPQGAQLAGLAGHRQDDRDLVRVIERARDDARLRGRARHALALADVRRLAVGLLAARHAGDAAVLRAAHLGVLAVGVGAAQRLAHAARADLVL